MVTLYHNFGLICVALSMVSVSYYLEIIVDIARMTSNVP